MSRRNFVLGIALLASVALSAWSLVKTDSDDLVVQAKVHPHAVTAVSASSAGTRTTGPDKTASPGDLSGRPAAPTQVTNLFATYSYEAPRAAPMPAPIEPPHAPPLPFVFTGRLIDQGRSTFLLLQGDATVAVTVGSDVGDFKLVEADPQHLVFLHGPTGQRVPLSIASESIH
jgi:hypothetical protein